MKPLTLQDLPDPERYEARRAALRDAVIAHKRERRVAVGDRVSLVFEDRETLRWQVLEMARVERIRDPRLLQQELDVYNELLPGEGELSATLFIEITDLAEIRPELDRLIGIDEHVVLRLGEGDGAETVAARFDEKQLEEDRIAAVQYVRFPLSAAQRERLADASCPVRVCVEHPNYRAEARLEAATRASLLRDLAGGGPPLLELPGEPAARAPDAPVAVSDTLRAWRRGPDHIDIEPREPVHDLAEAPPALLAEVTRLAAELAGRLGAEGGEDWELAVDLAERPVRWRLSPRR